MLEPNEDQELRDANNTYHLTDVGLGTGNFATVRLAFDWETGVRLAVKVIKSENEQTDSGDAGKLEQSDKHASKESRAKIFCFVGSGKRSFF